MLLLIEQILVPRSEPLREGVAEDGNVGVEQQYRLCGVHRIVREAPLGPCDLVISGLLVIARRHSRPGHTAHARSCRIGRRRATKAHEHDTRGQARERAHRAELLCMKLPVMRIEA